MFRISRVKGWCLLLLLLLTFWGVAQGIAQETDLPKGDLTTALQDFAKMDDGQKNLLLGSTGMPNPSSFNIVNLMAGVIFGSVGFIAFMYGKKNSGWRAMVIGIVLMVYPYFFSSTLALYGIGIALTAALWFFRD